MKEARVIYPSDIRLFYFGSKDVLNNKEAIDARRAKLHRAQRITHVEHIPISLYLRLPNGENLETESDMIDFADDFVILKGGFCIPIRIIFDVDI